MHTAQKTKPKLTWQHRLCGVLGAIVGGLISVFLPPIGVMICALLLAPLDHYHLASGGDPDVSPAGIIIIGGLFIDAIIYAALGWFIAVKLAVFATFNIMEVTEHASWSDNKFRCKSAPAPEN